MVSGVSITSTLGGAVVMPVFERASEHGLIGIAGSMKSMHYDIQY